MHPINSKLITKTPKEIIDDYSELFLREFGERKYKEVVEKVGTSTRVKSYVRDVIGADIVPMDRDISVVLNKIPYFFFSKGETLCLGGMIVCLMWLMSKGELGTVKTIESTAHLLQYMERCNLSKLERKSNIIRDMLDADK